MDSKSNDNEMRKYAREDAISLNYYIQKLLLLLGYARIWPAMSFTPWKMLLSTGVTIVFNSVNFFLLLTEIAALAMNNDLELIANIIGVISMHFAGLLKWCYCMIRRKEIVDIVMMLEKCHVLCQRIDNTQEGHRMYREEMKNARRYSNFFILCWTNLCVYGVLHWCINPLLIESWTANQIYSINSTHMRNLPFVGWHPWSIDNVYNYICLYIMQMIGGLSPVLGIACFDAFYVTLLIMVCAQFQYINAILTKVNSDNISDATFILEKKLKNCVDCHVQILKFIKKLQMFTNPTMFMQCIETLFIICLVSFEASAVKITIDKETILKLWSLLEYFLCAAVQLFSFCFFASRLEFLGLRLAYSVYACGWELTAFGKTKQSNIRKQFKQYDVDRLVQVITIQAQRPIILTGGPFYVLSLETFRIIISIALSNSVMLRTISDRND